MAGIKSAIVASRQIAEKCLEVIDNETLPPMSKQSAKEVLEEIQAACQSRIEALNDEMSE